MIIVLLARWNLVVNAIIVVVPATELCDEQGTVVDWDNAEPVGSFCLN